MRQQGGRYPQKEHRRSVEAAAEMLYSLKIQNATSCSSGMYRCTLEGPGGWRNPSGTVILKVTGEVMGCPVFFFRNACALSIGPKISPLNQSLTQKFWITSVAKS